MHANVMDAGLEIASFLASMLVFALLLRYYRRSKPGMLAAFSPPLERGLRQAHFLKICFFFSLFYFAVMTTYRHSGISCDALDEAAQCQCYALEVMHSKGMKQKRHWAENGSKMCPDSTFFTDFLKQTASAN